MERSAPQARRRRRLTRAGLAAALAFCLLAPRPGAAVSKDDCHDNCSKLQRECMFTCAAISDDADSKACVDSCVKKYKACAKKCR